MIGAKVDNRLALRETRLDLLFYVDAATDRTAVFPQDRDVMLYVAPQRAGKADGTNRLTKLADRCSFLPRRMRWSTRTRCTISSTISLSPRSAACAVTCATSIRTSARPANLGAFCWGFEEWIKQLETDIGSAMGADGSLFAIRHSLTRQVSDYLIDEMFVSLSILCDGHRVVRAGDVMELAATAPAEEFCRKSCIVCQTFNLHRRLWMHFGQLDRLTSYKYVCHKLLRWFSGISLALGTACRVLAVAATGYAEVVAGCFCLVPRWHWPVGGVGRNCLRVFGQIATAFAGTALRMWYLIRGVDFQVWTPAQFVRQRADGA